MFSRQKKSLLPRLKLFKIFSWNILAAFINKVLKYPPALVLGGSLSPKLGQLQKKFGVIKAVLHTGTTSLSIRSKGPILYGILLSHLGRCDKELADYFRFREETLIKAKWWLQSGYHENLVIYS